MLLTCAFPDGSPRPEVRLAAPGGAARRRRVSKARQAATRLRLEQLVLRGWPRSTDGQRRALDPVVRGGERVLALADVDLERRGARGVDRSGRAGQPGLAAGLVGLEREPLGIVALVGHDKPDRAGADAARGNQDAAVDDRRGEVDRGGRALPVDVVVVVAAAREPDQAREGECAGSQLHVRGPYTGGGAATPDSCRPGAGVSTTARVSPAGVRRPALRA